MWQDELPAKEVKEVDARNENGEGSKTNVDNTIKGTSSDAIEGQNGQIQSEKILNGNQTLNSANVNQTLVTQGSKITG